MMGVQASAGSAPTPTASGQVQCRCADFHPSLWGDHFIQYTSQNSSVDTGVEKQIKELTEEVRSKLVAATDIPLKKLNMIDAIQRLGLAYYFEKHIEEALDHTFQIYDDNADDLYLVALRFRLLRQQGYNVSCDIFNKFKEDDGKFKEAIISDAAGMLSLYEAAHLRIHGEEILDEALSFCINHLESLATQSSPPLGTQIINALKRPICRNIPRLETRQFISIYAEDDSHNQSLLKLAKLDFNRLQKIHQKELGEISKWWKDLNFVSKLPYIRNRVVECYMWIMSVFNQPEHHLARRFVSKVITMTSVIDDTYDIHGTYDELELFTEAIERWDMSSIDQLPEYMKIIYRALLDVYSEMEEEMAKQGTTHRLYYAREAMKNLARHYFVEAKWFTQGYVPTFEEYMRVATHTTGYSMLITSSFVAMGDLSTKETFEWVLSGPKSVEASTIICRLMDDIQSHELEQKRGHVASAVECYMSQHGVSEEEACQEFERQLEDAWKTISQELIKPTPIPGPLLTCVLDFARVIDVLYKYGSGYTNSHITTKDHVYSLLINPIIV